MKTGIIIVIFSFFVIQSNLFSQEYQIPMDLNNTVLEIDSTLDLKLQLFNDIQGFAIAQLYQINDTTFYLEVSYKVDGRILRQKTNMNPKELLAFRTEVTDKLIVENPELKLNHEGRAELLTASTILSLLAYAPLALEVVQPDDGKVTTGIYLLIGAGGFFIPYYATKNATVTQSSATMFEYGSLLGMAQSALIFSTISSDNRMLCGVTLLGGLGEGIGGYLWAKNYNIEAGRADVVGSMGIFGAGYGLGISNLAGGNDEDVLKLMAAGGSIAGMFAGNYIAKQQFCSRGDATIFTVAGTLGTYISMMSTLICEADNVETYSLTGILGCTAGLAIGANLIKDHNFSYSQGIYIGLGTYAGGLLGMGVGLLSDDPKVVMGCGMAGSLLGFTLVYESFKDEASVEEEKASNFDIKFNPSGLMGFLDKPSSSPEIKPYYRNDFLSLSYKF